MKSSLYGRKMFMIWEVKPVLNFLRLLGRSLLNSVYNLGIKDQYSEALQQLGFDLEVLAEQVFSLWHLANLFMQSVFQVSFF